MNTLRNIKVLLIVYSYHHNNTLKVAKAFSSVLHATIITPEDIHNTPLNDYDLIGFGSGIDSGKHYQPLLNIANQLETVKEKPCFIFSTSAVQGKTKVDNDHSALRNILIAKGYIVIDDLEHAKAFANLLLQHPIFNPSK